MKGKIQVIISIILLLFTITSSTYEKDWSSGVSRGDYFTYEMYGAYTSNTPEKEIDIPAFERNTTDWVRIDIKSVEDSVVNQIYTLHYLDGSEKVFNFQTDLNPKNQGIFKMVNKGVPICPTNLKPGERMPTAELIINETISRVYQTSNRETNHASWNISDDLGDIYFDKETGMMVELRRTHLFVNTVTGEVVEKTDIIKLIDTNRWQIK